MITEPSEDPFLAGYQNCRSNHGFVHSVGQTRAGLHDSAHHANASDGSSSCTATSGQMKFLQSAFQSRKLLFAAERE
jgi:hypothetical protein